MRNRLLPLAFVVLIVALIGVGVIYFENHSKIAPTATPSASTLLNSASPAPSASAGAPSLASPSPSINPSPAAMPSSNPTPDLTVDESGLSKATVVVTTSRGVIKFKLYPQDAPNTVKRIVELIQQGFYNGLSWHRVSPGFVIQGGDPQGTGNGGSGQKLKAEFNDRRHIEGTVAMARGSDKDSADSQFYISLGTFPHLDHSYTVFGQVIEGMDVARKIRVGDKMVSIVVQ
jgi:cyclophilin family peptidyl-prolyl cis-trans isomerase